MLLAIKPDRLEILGQEAPCATLMHPSFAGGCIYVRRCRERVLLSVRHSVASLAAILAGGHGKPASTACDGDERSIIDSSPIPFPFLRGPIMRRLARVLSIRVLLSLLSIVTTMVSAAELKTPARPIAKVEGRPVTRTVTTNQFARITALREPVSRSSLWVRPGSRKCTCVSSRRAGCAGPCSRSPRRPRPVRARRSRRSGHWRCRCRARPRRPD